MSNIKDKPRYFYHHGLSRWLEIVPHPNGTNCFHSGVVGDEKCVLFAKADKHCNQSSSLPARCSRQKATFKEIPIVQH